MYTYICIYMQVWKDADPAAKCTALLPDATPGYNTDMETTETYNKEGMHEKVCRMSPSESCLLSMSHVSYL